MVCSRGPLRTCILYMLTHFMERVDGVHVAECMDGIRRRSIRMRVGLEKGGKGGDVGVFQLFHRESKRH